MESQGKRRQAIWYGIVFAAVVAADQGLKSWVTGHIPLNAGPEDQIPLVPGFIHLTYIRNRGAAFGMLQGGRWLFLALLAMFCVLAVWALATNRLRRPSERWLAVLAMAGAVGNGIDRAVHGYVVDMFELEFMEFAVFNIADFVINVSCIAFVLLMLLSREESRDGEQPGGAQP